MLLALAKPLSLTKLVLALAVVLLLEDAPLFIKLLMTGFMMDAELEAEDWRFFALLGLLSTGLFK
jgi:hypothetical protein